MDMTYKQILTDDMEHCIICGKSPVEIHHTMFGKNRKLATEDGLVVPLCFEHHRGTYGVHGREGHETDLFLKRLSEIRWCLYYEKNIDDWIKRYGRNYI